MKFWNIARLNYFLIIQALDLFRNQSEFPTRPYSLAQNANKMLTSAQPNITTLDPSKAAPGSEKENRRLQRISLPLPVRVEVKVDSTMTWNEITRLSDISAFGAGFTLKRPVKRGRLIQMTVPMPRQLRCFDYGEAQYKIWGLVRKCIETANRGTEPSFAVGVAFTGKNPPTDYLNHPSRLYDISRRDSETDGFWHLEPADLRADDSDLPKDLRKQTRFSIPESLTLELLDENGNVTTYETTVTENLSIGGAAVFTQHALDEGTFLRVTSERFNVTILSVVRKRRVGGDGLSRLHLEFIDRLFPLQGID